MNRRGAEKLMSIWWFFVLALIAVGIVSGVVIFYSGNVDVRAIEADILSGKILGCINDNGFLIDEFLKNDFNEVSLMEKCGLNKKMFEGNEEFYFKVSLFENENKIKEIESSLGSFEVDCELSSSIIANNYPRCVEKKENVEAYYNGVKSLRLEVITGSNQFGKKAFPSEVLNE